MIDLEQTQELEPLQPITGTLSLAAIRYRITRDQVARAVVGGVARAALVEARSPLFRAALEYMMPDSDRLAILAKMRERYPMHTPDQLQTVLKETCVAFASAGVWPKVGP